MKKLSLLRLIIFAVLFVCLISFVSCGDKTNDGEIINPGINTGDGSDNSSNNDSTPNDQHAHIYKLDEASSTYSCVNGNTLVYVCKCGAKTTEQDAPMGHDLRSYDGKAATCTEDGYAPYEKCTRTNCNYTTYSPIMSRGHDYMSYAAKEPTCTEFGWNAYEVCRACGVSTYVQLAANGHSYVNGYCACGRFDYSGHTHSWDNGVVVVASSCTSSGIIKYTCTDSYCGDVNMEVISATGHQYVNVDAKAATCSNDGWSSHSECSVCGYNNKVVVSALGHVLKAVDQKNATCTESGHLSYYECTRVNCDGIGISKPTEIAPLGHSMVSFADIQPTCTEYGATNHRECNRSGCTYVEKSLVNPLGHSLKVVTGKAATCTEDGYLSYQICTRSGCDGSGIESPVVIKALGHNDVHYDAKSPTCTEYGWSAYDVCQTCNRSTYVKIEALGHNYVNGYCDCGHYNPAGHSHIWNSGEVVSSATCTTVGSMMYTCTDPNCLDTKITEIKALGHDKVSYGAKSPTCTTDGWLAYEECTRCDLSTYVVDPALGHDYNNGVVTTQPTCVLSGVRTYTCMRSGCDRSYQVEVDKLGHDYGEWYETKEATCTTNGMEVSECLNGCGSVNKRTVQKLGHDFGTWKVKTAATCITEGYEIRSCLNVGCSAFEENIIPVTGHTLNSDGKCLACGKEINSPLATPEITSFNNYIIFWDDVAGADHYELKIIYEGNDIRVKVFDKTTYSLEEYFMNCNILEVYIRAMSAQGSNTANSEYAKYKFEVPEGTVAEYSALGAGVNLIENSYTDMEHKAVSIFNPYTFNRLTADEEVPLYKHYSDATLSNSLESYASTLTQGLNTKMDVKASVGYAGIAKATMGFNFEVDESYEKKAYNETQAIFYDMYYEYRGYKTGIANFLSSLTLKTSSEKKAILEDLTTAQFREHARMLQDGELTPGEFVDMYGTHIITEAIYGAQFTAHFEMLTSKSTASELFSDKIKEGINFAIQACIYGVDIGLEMNSEVTATSSTFMDSQSSDTVSKFRFDAKGGRKPVDMSAISLEDFSKVSDAWANSMSGRDDFEIIDVGDESLYFVWEFLSDDFAEAKQILNDYFYTTCEANFEDISDKISGMYADYFHFDEKTGTLTFDLAGLQKPGTENTKLDNVLYQDSNTDIFNGEKHLVTVYSKFAGKDVKKIVFIGAYQTRENMNNRLINNCFESISIKFDESWTDDIVVEFVNFAFVAPDGKNAIDFSEASSKNITIIATGTNYARGGNGVAVNEEGFEGIHTTSTQKLTIKGKENIEIVDGAKILASYEYLDKIHTVTSSGYEHLCSFGLDKNKLIELGFTKVEITLYLWGQFISADWFKADWTMKVTNEAKESLLNKRYDSWEHAWSNKIITFTINVSDLNDDGSITLIFGHKGDSADNWRIENISMSAKVS